MSEPSIGIDLGTTNSVVATVVDGKPHVIERRTGQRLLPSMVGFQDDGTRVVGEAARELARSRPENVAYATKRFMGQRWSPDLASKVRGLLPFPVVAGPNEDVRVRIAGKTLPVVQIGAMILSELRADAEAFFGKPVKRAVITVPANFNDAQRQATKESAAIAGLEVLRLINEPTAAALAYGLTTGFEGSALVFDLGGGTFDVSVLEVRQGVFEVVCTGGDAFLGGEDVDQAIVQWLVTHVEDRAMRERVQHDKAAMHHLKVLAEGAKIAISTTQEAPVSTILLPDHHGGVLVQATLTRPVLEQLVQPFAERCVEIIDRTLFDANIVAEGVKRILMVGGMSRMPLIRRIVADRFKTEPETGINPDEVVAMGAAIQAAELEGRAGNVLLLDVVSSTLGVQIAHGLTKPLIQKNTRLPVKATEIFHPATDDQQLVRIPVVQGESINAKENFRLGELSLSMKRPGLRWSTSVEVCFEMGTDGILGVDVTELATGRKESARLTARTDMPAAELERLKKAEAEESRTQLHRVEEQPSTPPPRTSSDKTVIEEHPSPPDDSRTQVVSTSQLQLAQEASARGALRDTIAKARALYDGLQKAAVEGGNADVRMATEELARFIVEAEAVERSGQLEQLTASSTGLTQLIGSLEQAQKPRPAEAS